MHIFKEMQKSSASKCLSHMDVRLQAFENQQHTSSLYPILDDSGIYPQATLTSTFQTHESLNFQTGETLSPTVLTASPGVPFFPAAITPQLKAQILAGNNINLVDSCYALNLGINE